MPLSLLSPSVLVPSAVALTVGAFVLAGQPSLFLATGTGALGAWGLALRSAFHTESGA